MRKNEFLKGQYDFIEKAVRVSLKKAQKKKVENTGIPILYPLYLHYLIWDFWLKPLMIIQ